jgi:hypothetical protein
MVQVSSGSIARARRENLRRISQLLQVLDGKNVSQLVQLRALHDAQKAIEEATDTAVIQARDGGATWSAIGASLGMSAQAVAQRAQKLGYVTSSTSVERNSGAISA